MIDSQRLALLIIQIDRVISLAGHLHQEIGGDFADIAARELQIERQRLIDMIVGVQ